MKHLPICKNCGATAPTWTELLAECVCAKPKTDAATSTVDELGKVWDVLHAAGINGTGDMSASEGVALLVKNMESMRDRRNSITLMRGLLIRVLDCGRLSFEADAPEEVEALEVDICAALHQVRLQR